MKECSVQGCGGITVAKGVCDKHYRRLKRTGSLADPVRKPKKVRKKRLSAEERFKKGFEVDEETGCWLWVKGKARGYGQLSVGGRNMYAHRFSWELHNGPIPKGDLPSYHGICVCHSCDTPHCVNPAHLFLGTQLRNITDRERKGRGNHQAKRKKRET